MTRNFLQIEKYLSPAAQALKKLLFEIAEASLAAEASIIDFTIGRFISRSPIYLNPSNVLASSRIKNR